MGDSLEQSAADLGGTPDLVLLHNPERTLEGLSANVGREVLAAAISALVDATAEGLAKVWGISTWRAAVTAEYADGCPAPDVLMTRCGLTVSGQLEATEHLAELLGVTPSSRWGMAPLGGVPAAVTWPAPDTFAPGQPCSPVQAAFAVAYQLPEVAAVSVGADRPEHLAELVDAAQFGIDRQRVVAYRNLLTEQKATVTP
jgi:aryl-alcohol dehydrogenase-like predicted oxidoreductase